MNPVKNETQGIIATAMMPFLLAVLSLTGKTRRRLPVRWHVRRVTVGGNQA
ncbi:MAG: hypothetical protein WBD31_28675 [Rubripirellula sp.]